MYAKIFQHSCVADACSDPCEFTPGSPFSTWLTVFQTVFLILSLLASILLNASFTIVVIMYKALRHQKDTLMNLALTVPNICSSIVGTIPTIASMIDGKWPLGKPFCYAIGTLGLIFTLLRYTSILAITVDRFGAVMCPFQYPKHGAKIAAVIFSVGIYYSIAGI